MLIEYKIKFEDDGLTIRQYIEPNSVPLQGSTNNAVQGITNSKVKVNGLPATQGEVKALAAVNPLANLSAKDIATGPIDETAGPIDETAGPIDETAGQAGQGSAPIFILGPIVFGGSVPQERTKSVTEPPQESPQKALGKAAGK
jgi:hypothetical protein